MGLCRHTCCAAEGRREEATRVTLLATSVIASTFDFTRSWTHIDKLVCRDKVLYDVGSSCVFFFFFTDTRTPLLIPGKEGSDVLSVSFLSTVLKVPKDDDATALTLLGVEPICHVSLSSHLEQLLVRDTQPPGSGLHDKENSNYDHPWPSGRTRKFPHE